MPIVVAGVALVFAWKSLRRLYDAARGDVQHVEGQLDFRASTGGRGVDSYYVRAGAIEFSVRYLVWTVLREHRSTRYRVCYLPRARRVVSVTQL